MTQADLESLLDVCCHSHDLILHPQPRKIYVQHIIEKNGAMVWNYMSRGASILLAGCVGCQVANGGGTRTRLGRKLERKQEPDLGFARTLLTASHLTNPSNAKRMPVDVRDAFKTVAQEHGV